MPIYFTVLFLFYFVREFSRTATLVRTRSQFIHELVPLVRTRLQRLSSLSWTLVRTRSRNLYLSLMFCSDFVCEVLHWFEPGFEPGAVIVDSVVNILYWFEPGAITLRLFCSCICAVVRTRPWRTTFTIANELKLESRLGIKDLFHSAQGKVGKDPKERRFAFKVLCGDARSSAFCRDRRARVYVSLRRGSTADNRCWPEETSRIQHMVTTFLS